MRQSREDEYCLISLRWECVRGPGFQLEMMKMSQDGWWRWLHSNVNVLNCAIHLHMINMVNFLLYVFYHSKVKEWVVFTEQHQSLHVRSSVCVPLLGQAWRAAAPHAWKTNGCGSKPVSRSASPQTPIGQAFLSE